ncbi:MAG: hypothetical protein FRX48_06283 [Lasallia pustulata]|uniref:SWIRM domain-containing protein n=1 Tax=Lasallia pustulata TaxID=136370 RepID=A0A5M8PJQ9_9LECA|nr:MAG: hypothetical protein FRX48_06283 [Lasallia pustulata]
MDRLPPIASLMSPPEAKPFDTFSPISSPAKLQVSNSRSSFTPANTLPPISDCRSPGINAMKVLPSPPVSPWPSEGKEEDGRSNKGEDNSDKVYATPDPVLYPSSDAGTEIASHEPLFPIEPSLADAEDLVTQHMASRVTQFNRPIHQPTREEYLLALSCVPIVGRGYNRNPGAWLKRQRDEIEEQYSQTKRICGAPASKRSPTNIKIAPAPSQRQPKKLVRTISATGPTVPSIRVKRAPKQSPKERLLESPRVGRSATPEMRVTGMKRPEDTDYNALPDFAPPTSTLPKGNAKILKADWGSTNPLNLSNDPDRHMLHESEIHLASTLRLSCATYLCSKRRIFEARLRALNIGKEFRKTDAQQACKIDVNKASKLWTAYDKVGWFNKHYFEQYL